MPLMQSIATVLRPALQNSVIRRTRRNHAYEHATIHMLNRQRYTLSGNSNAGGFMLVGDVPTEKVEAAAREALRRLKGGESQLAIHPNCGTNLVVTGLLTTSLAALGFTGTSRKSAWERFPIVMLFMMFAALYSQPLGMTVQKYITTEGNPGDLEYVSVTRRETHLPVIGKLVIHDVKTTKG